MPKFLTHHLGDLLFETRVGEHVVRNDVPLSMGGAERAPTPPQLLVCALGGCVAAFVATYCRQVGLDDTDLSVETSFDKVENPSRLVGFRVRVFLPNATVGKREAAIRRVIEMCPVHGSLEAFEGLEIEIVDRG